MFSSLSKTSLAKAVLFHNTPIYVQFYITARCNLTCKQCNIIYANSDTAECSLDQIQLIADNLAKLGVAIVLLTGGEPFVRKDLPQIISAFESRGVHVRMQTNGLATEEQIHASIEAGGRDISISLDSLNAEKQEKINGGIKDSWHRALRAISLFTKYLPVQNSFGALGCVLQRENLPDIIEVIKFGKLIDWYVSLVPVHVTRLSKPAGFRTFDRSIEIKPEQFELVDGVIEQVRDMRNKGYLLYDSDQYLDDIRRFVRGERITWRDKNSGVCDSPGLYFAILPSGRFAPCCDHRVDEAPATFDPNFITYYRSKQFRDRVFKVVSACQGCMYGSYPEMTISMRYWRDMIKRLKLFLIDPPRKNWPLSYERLLELAGSVHQASMQQNDQGGIRR